MRIATWNINGLRARLDFLKLWLRERQPDLVGLQELKMTDDQFPHDVLAEEGYRAAVHGQKSWNGVAILSKQPVEVLQSGLPGQEDFGARLITAKLRDFTFTTVYCPNGKNLEHADYRRKLAWFDSLSEHLSTAGRNGEPGVLCGDMNICPAPIDSWNEDKLAGDIFHTDDERARMARLYADGWKDLWRATHPDEQAFSWWDYRGGAFHRKQGLRIDFLLATAAAAARTTHVEIDREWRKKKGDLTASDHAPVFADLD